MVAFHLRQDGRVPTSRCNAKLISGGLPEADSAEVFFGDNIIDAKRAVKIRKSEFHNKIPFDGFQNMPMVLNRKIQPKIVTQERADVRMTQFPARGPSLPIC